jgi:two-component system CheB/CheR fusion protein
VEYLEIARRNVELEARLIDDLLDVTRIARGRIELDRKVVDLCTVLNRAAEVCRPDIDARQLHFGIRVDNGPHVVQVDPARMQQVFWNLIKNSVKFTPHGGYVGVHCWRHHDRAFIEVQDSGEGIEPSALGRIFNAFEQEEMSSRRQFGGLGLGLAISKALVEMHGGSISARSDGKGKGATFTVDLPIYVPHPPAGRLPTAVSPAAPQQPARTLKILLVEDHGDTAHVIGRLLGAHGHSVRHAGDVATALELVDQESFDVMLSDLGLPDGSGHDLMRALAARGKRLPAIALSGYGMAADVQASRDAGFLEHVTKPVDIESLLTAINRAVAGESRPAAP